MDIYILCVSILIAVLLFLSQADAVVENNLINEFFTKKHCTLGTAFLCSSKKERIELAKYLMTNGLRVSVLDLTIDRFPGAKVLAREHSHLAVVVDASCENSQQFLEESGSLGFFSELYHWLVFESSTNFTGRFNDIWMYVNADITVVVPSSNVSSNTTDWDVFDVYNPAYEKGGTLRIEKLGIYNNEEGFSAKIEAKKYQKRQNMGGLVFNAVIIIPENITMDLREYIASDEDRNNNTSNRFQGIVLSNCMTLFNTSINPSRTESWGYQNDQGQFNGLVRLVQDKTVDFGLSPIMYKLPRKMVIDYGHATWILRSTFIFRHPKTTFTSYEIYVRPLVNSVWLSAFGVLIAIIVVFRLALKTETIFVKNLKEYVDASWSFLILYGVGEFCQQGFAMNPIFNSGKLVTFVTLLFSFLLYQFYSASVVSLLLVDPPRRIVTFADLLNSSLRAGCEDILWDVNYFLQTTDPIALDIYKKKIKATKNSSGFYVPEIGLDKVAKGGFAYHIQRSVAYPIIKRTFSEKSICELAEIDMYPTQGMYLVVQKKSPFLQILNFCILHQAETGVLARLRLHWGSDEPKCVKSADTIDISVGLTESYWSIVLWGVGMSFSLAILGLEILWAKRCNLKREYNKSKSGKKQTKAKYIVPFVK